MQRRERILWWMLAGAGVLWMASQTTTGSNLIGAAISRALALVKRWEGLSLKAYQDVAGYWTIGYGHLVKPGEPYHPYGPKREITEAEASALLDRDMTAARNAVTNYVTAPLTTGMRAALESLAFNIGPGAFAASTLVRKLNAGDKQGAADEFLRWTKAGGSIVQGLVNRRQAERAEFLS